MAARSVLIAEDETIIAWELRKLAQSWGLSVSGSVDSGAAAIEAFDRDGADLVLLDIFLADSVSGIEVARHIRERSSAPIIFITASQDRGTKELAMAEGPENSGLSPLLRRLFRSSATTKLSKIFPRFG